MFPILGERLHGARQIPRWNRTFTWALLSHWVRKAELKPKLLGVQPKEIGMGQMFSKNWGAALIVEDDEDLRSFAVELVSEFHREVLDCDSAETALEIMEKRGNDIAILFSDIDLAGSLNGVQLAQTIATRWPHVKLIVTSGGPRVQLQRLPKKARFMPKPYEAMDLIVAVESSIQRPIAG
jgi:CheY-like chemotaxis protein